MRSLGRRGSFGMSGMVTAFERVLVLNPTETVRS